MGNLPDWKLVSQLFKNPRGKIFGKCTSLDWFSFTMKSQRFFLLLFKSKFNDDFSTMTRQKYETDNFQLKCMQEITLQHIFFLQFILLTANI